MQTQLPFFYIPSFDQGPYLDLGEENSRHIIQVLRMKKGEPLKLTDGLGHILLAEVWEEHKKHGRVIIKKVDEVKPPSPKTTLAISLVKNASRFEWFLEKATEIGIGCIQPLICTRTEREKFRYDRFQGILISAMLQSQQAWLPVLEEPVNLSDYLNKDHGQAEKFIAHCVEGNKQDLGTRSFSGEERILLIGPEGDFTPEEIDLAIAQGFLPVSLGETRLRTETAGIVGSVLLRRG